MPNGPEPVIPDASSEALHGTRRRLLASTALALFAGGISGAAARTIAGHVPWTPFAATPPEPVQGEGWVFFAPEEAATVEAIVERLIPADNLSPSGKDAGCAVFIDRQLAGPYGDSRKLYMQPPFHIGTTTQGLQSGITPALRYRAGLAALNARCRQAFGGKEFAALDSGQRDDLLREMETKRLNPADPADERALFELLLQNTREGFFADPIYGGNRDMAGWKMIGFPGYRYDYRDFIRRYNEDYKLPPLAIGGRPAWYVGGTR
jgi:gluconate 2-dehydrogenase gamma chain